MERSEPTSNPIRPLEARNLHILLQSVSDGLTNGDDLSCGWLGDPDARSGVSAFSDDISAGWAAHLAALTTSAGCSCHGSSLGGLELLE